MGCTFQGVPKVFSGPCCWCQGPSCQLVASLLLVGAPPSRRRLLRLFTPGFHPRAVQRLTKSRPSSQLISLRQPLARTIGSETKIASQPATKSFSCIFARVPCLAWLDDRTVRGAEVSSGWTLLLASTTHFAAAAARVSPRPQVFRFIHQVAAA